MSLVILSNDAKEQSDLVSTNQSIYKPWSFRNSLTSTMEIPANGQIALTSAKISLDGQVSLAAGEKVLYVYIGKWLDEDQDLQESNSVPIKVKLYEDEPGVVVTDTEGLARELEDSLNKYVLHPNYTKRCKVNVNRNPTTGEFEGYEIVLKQTDLATATIPGPVGAANMIAESTDMFSFRVRQTPADRDYTMTTNANNHVILTPTSFQNHILSSTFNMTTSTPPITLADGLLGFDVTRCIGNGQVGAANLNCEFFCGLSRFCNTGQRRAFNRPGPPYYYWSDSVHAGRNQPISWLRCFADFVVVNTAGELRLYDTSINGDAPRPGSGGNRRTPRWREIDYTQGGTRAAPFDVLYNTTANASRFERVQFQVKGEQVAINMIDNTGQAHLLYRYDQLRDDGVTARLPGEIMKPIDQGCECMMPVMGLFNDGVRNVGNQPGDYSIALDIYTGLDVIDLGPFFLYTTDLATYEADKRNATIPWYNLIEQGDPAEFMNIIKSLENRAGRLQVAHGDLTNSNQFRNCWKPVIITSPSSQYSQTQGANTMRLLGFSDINGVAAGDTIWDDQGEDANGQFVYSLVSTDTPIALSSKSIFVRVDNFNQTSTNAANGNKSGIVAHLPRFDGQQQTGRLFFEPKNLIYLDLNNPAPMKVNSFDISFVYSDETYCKSLVGSSIVTLHIREKGTTN